MQERVAGPSATHRVVAVPTDGSGASVVLVDHGHFVAAPRPSPDGRWLAWCTWDHPDMPWDATVLRVAPLDSGPPAIRLGAPVDVAGGPGVSVGQPRWTADGGLVFVDDRYRLVASLPGGTRSAGGHQGRVGRPGGRVHPLVEIDAEFHGPDWVFGLHTFDELADGALVARMGTGGRDHLVVLRPPSGGPDSGRWSMTEVAQPCVSLAGVVSPDGVSVVICGTTPTESQAVFAVAPDGTIPPRRLSAAPAVVVTTERASHSRPHRATVGDHVVPGLFFPPTNPDVVAHPGFPPPLVVFCHGGPTAAAEPGYDPAIQFLTSRGIAVAAVDYRGSTGYGRAYRDLLRGTWGEGDVDDCVAYARSLAVEGWVDGRRMAIRGGSAGGLTALAALDPGPGVRRRRGLVRGDRPGGARHRYPRLRVPLPGPPGRPAAGGGRRLP